MPQTRPIVRVAGLFCLIGAGLVVLGTYLTWYHVDSASRFGSTTLNVDLYQLSPTRLTRPFNTWSPAAMGVGAAWLAVAGLGMVTLARRIPLFLTCLWIVIASALTTFGALETRVQATSVAHVFISTTRGPGEAVTLVGAGLGILAVIVVLRDHVARPRHAPSRTAYASYD